MFAFYYVLCQSIYVFTHYISVDIDTSHDSGSDSIGNVTHEEMLATLPMIAINAVLESSQPVHLCEDFMDGLSYLHDHDKELYEYMSHVELEDSLGNVLCTDDILKVDSSHDNTLSKHPLFVN